jgi:hypothetical protein
MSPETTIQKTRRAPEATSVHHIVRASSRTRTPRDPVQQSDPLVRKLPRTASINDRHLRRSNSYRVRVRRKQLFNPQPKARKLLFCTHVVLSNATIRTGLDLSSIKTNPITAQKVLRLGCLDSIASTSTVSLSTSTTKSDARHVTTVVTRHVALLFVIQEHRSASAGF